MRQISNLELSELTILGKKLGLTRRNIAAMLKDMPHRSKQPSFVIGPPDPYKGGYYGTISIFDINH
jgi:hypothetical protein